LYEGNLDVLHPPCCHCHVTYQCQLPRFTAIHKSPPMASWDSKVSIICTLHNLGGNSRSSRDFSLLFFEYYVFELGMKQLLVSRFTAVWKSHGFKTSCFVQLKSLEANDTAEARHTKFTNGRARSYLKNKVDVVPLVWVVFFYVSSRTETAVIPQVVCSVESNTTPPPPLGGASSQTDSHLCVGWMEEVNPWNFFPPSKKMKSAV